MSKTTTLIVLGTAHRKREPGKSSPDGRLREYRYSRDICEEVCKRLQAQGYSCEVDWAADDLEPAQQSSSYTQERNRELVMRVNHVNALCKQKGTKNVLYVSVHCNAAGSNGQWNKAQGWQVHVGVKASQNSKALADCLYDAAKTQGLKMRQPSPTQKFWPQNLYVLNKTLCPAVLTENLFQDNKADVDFLLSDKGREAIVVLHVKGITDYVEKH